MGGPIVVLKIIIAMNIALSPLDVTLVVAYLVGVTILGLWYSRGIKSSKDYFLAGRSLPWWAVGMSLVVSDIGRKDMVGWPRRLSLRPGDDELRSSAVRFRCWWPPLFMPFFRWRASTIPEYLGRQSKGPHDLRFSLGLLHDRNRGDDLRQPRQCSRARAELLASSADGILSPPTRPAAG